MHYRHAVVGLTLAIFGLGAAAAAARAADATLDVPTIKKAAGASVCLVVAQNGYGMSMGRASGFAFGEGKFVLTDLGALAQDGVARASIQFPDGTMASATQFGMADPVLGLTVIRLDEGSPVVPGLALAADPPSLDDPPPVCRLGWKWGKELSVSVGRLAKGPDLADLASKINVKLPAEAPALLSMEGMRPEGCDGGPVVTKDGVVVGVAVEIDGPGGTASLVVPALAIRKALASATPKLSPLKELPKPLWPGPVYRVPGEPIKPGQFSGTIGSIRLRVKCSQCGGKGQVTVEKVVGTERIGGVERKITRMVPETCNKCQGEGVVFVPALYPIFTNMGEQGLKMLAFPDTDDKALEAAQKNGRQVLSSLGEVGSRFRDAFSKAAKDDLDRGAQFPRGAVVYAQVRDTLDGTDGKYVVLAPYQSATLLLMRSDPTAASESRILSAKASEPSPKASDAKAPAGRSVARPTLGYGRWIVLAGLLVGSVEVESRHYIHILPFDWAQGPNLGPAPRPRGPMAPTEPGDESEPETKPPKRTGAPEFFGV